MNNTMKKPLFATLACLLIVSCTGKEESRQETVSQEVESPADYSAVTLEEKPHVGGLVSRVFMGMCEENATCILTHFSYEYSGDGIFSFTILRPGNKLSVYKGKVYTQKGSDNATLWQCVTNDQAHVFYFLTDADGQRIYKEQDDSHYQKRYMLTSLSAQEP